MKKRTRIIISVISFILAAALLCALVMLTLKYNEMKSLYVERTASDGAKISALESDNASLTDKLSAAKGDISELESSLADVEGYYSKHYSDKIAENDRKIKELDESREKLEAMIEKSKNKDGFDIAELYGKISSLEDYIENESPLVCVMLTEEEIAALEEENKDSETEIADHRWDSADKYIEKGKAALGDTYNEAMPLKDIIAPTGTETPKIAVYYEDLSSGYKYTYNGGMVFDSASVMKAPYITAILEACADYEAGKLEVPEDDEKYSEEKLAEMFDLDKKIILDHETMDKPGSGVLIDAEDGSEYTYRELIELSLENSDNIAFALVREHFTNKWYFDFVRENNAVSPLSYYMNMSVNEAGAMFKSMYYFMLEGTEYGELIKESLTNSAHTVLSVNALGKNKVAHKYGWDVDAYHDAAIVYGDRPYIAIVFTDIDSGGSVADSYIRGIFKKIGEIHNFLA